jgi:hypothetical protein
MSVPSCNGNLGLKCGESSPEVAPAKSLSETLVTCGLYKRSVVTESIRSGYGLGLSSHQTLFKGNSKIGTRKGKLWAYLSIRGSLCHMQKALEELQDLIYPVKHQSM